MEPGHPRVKFEGEVREDLSARKIAASGSHHKYHSRVNVRFVLYNKSTIHVTRSFRNVKKFLFTSVLSYFRRSELDRCSLDAIQNARNIIIIDNIYVIRLEAL